MTIYIDCGHGGPDRGCSSYGLVESILTWHLANLLTGFDKRLSRGEDEDPSFAVRAARSAGCTAALSLHFNSGDLRYSKPEIYYRGPEAPLFWLDEIEGSVGQRLSHTLQYPMSFGKRVGIFDTSKYERSGKRKELEWLERPDTVVRQYTIPTVLLEVGYLNDSKVSSYIYDVGLSELAEGISAWVCERITKSLEVGV